MSDLGIHSKLDGLDQSLLGSFQQSHMSIFVGVGTAAGLPIMAALHNGPNDHVQVYRFIQYDKESGGKWPAMKPGTDPVQAAQIWLNDIIANGAKSYPWIYYQALNEPKDDYAWLAAFDAERIRLCKANGLRCTIATFAMGNPQPADWETYLPALQAANAAGPGVVLVALHVYWPKADDPMSDATWYLLRDQNLLNTLAAHGLTNIKRIYTEFGANTVGYQAFPGMTNEKYIQLLILADSKIPGVPKAIYDCSSIPDSRSESTTFSIQVPFGPSGGQTRAVDLLIPVLNSQTASSTPVQPPADPPPVTPPPVTPPPLTGWTKVNISNPSFEGATYIEPDDSLGMRRIPQDWNLNWLTRQMPPHSELEQHPTHVADGQYSARVYADGQWHAWLWRKIKVPSQARIRLTVKSLGTATVTPDTASRPGETVDRWLGIDAQGTDWPSSPISPEGTGLVWSDVMSQMDIYGTQVFEAQALGDTVTIMLRARHRQDAGRSDVFWDAVTVEYQPVNGQTPQPMNFPFQVQIQTSASYIYVRSAPDSSSDANRQGTAWVGSTWWVDGVSTDGRWWKLQGQDRWISRQLTRVL